MLRLLYAETYKLRKSKSFFTSSLTSLFVLIGEISRNIATGIAIGIDTAAFPALLLNILDMQFADNRITPSQFWWKKTANRVCRSHGLHARFGRTVRLLSAIQKP